MESLKIDAMLTREQNNLYFVRSFVPALKSETGGEKKGTSSVCRL